MAISIAFLADPHLAVEARRGNILSLRKRELWKRIDVRRPMHSLRGLVKPTSYCDDVLLNAVKWLSNVSHELDLIVILGDLATTGQKEDLDVARAIFCDNNVVEYANGNLSPRFASLGVPLMVLPGNHDRYKDDFATHGGTLFDTTFNDIYQPTNGVTARTIGSDELQVSVVTADFCFPESFDVSIPRRYGRGAVTDSVLSELRQRTIQCQSTEKYHPVIWALHFSPAEGVSSSLILEERERVTDLAVELGVNHIFCGHTHLRKRDIGTFPHIYAAGSVSSVDSEDNHFMHICIIDGKDAAPPELLVYDLKYDLASEKFVPFPIPTIA